MPPPVTLPGKTVPQLTAATRLDVTDAGLFIFRPEATGVLSKLPASDLPAAAGGPGDVRRYGAKFDGTLHMLSEFFPTVNAARAKLGSFVRNLNESIDRCATQAAVNAVTTISGHGGCFPVILPPGIGIWDYPVDLKNKPVQIVGAGPLQTVLQHTTDSPFFMSTPADIVLPSVVTGAPTGQKAIKFAGTVNDGLVRVSDASTISPNNITQAAATLEAWIRIDDAFPGEGDLRTTIWCGGSADASAENPGGWDITVSPELVTLGGVKKCRLFAKKTGQQDFADFALPNNPSAGQWHHLAVTIAGDVYKLWWDGSLVGTLTLTFASGRSIKPWEDFGIGTQPFGWPLGSSVNTALDGAFACYRLSRVVRYTGTFTPPTAPFTSDSNTVVLTDFDNISGILIPYTTGVSGTSSGHVLWHQGNYSGDVSGMGIYGVKFLFGSFGIYAFGVHNARFCYIHSIFTNYPIWLEGHSFQNTVTDVFLSSGRVGIAFLGTSFGTVSNFEISGMWGFAAVCTDGAIRLQDGFTFALGAGTLLARTSTVVVDNVFQTDEAISTAITYGFYCSGCPTVEITNSIFLASLTSPAPTIPIQLVGALSATVSNFTFYVGDTYTECISTRLGGPTSSTLWFQTQIITFGCVVLSASSGFASTVPLTATPARFKSLDALTPKSVNDNATLATNILTHAAKSGLVLAVDATTPRDALYRLTGTTLTLVSGDAVFSTAQGTPAKVNVYVTGGKVTMENKTGGTLLLAAYEK